MNPTVIAVALGAIYGYLDPFDMRSAAFRVWPCPCTDPRQPKRLTLCPICKGTKRAISVP